MILLAPHEHGYVFALSPPLMFETGLFNIVTSSYYLLFFLQAEDGIRARTVTGVQTCALPISDQARRPVHAVRRRGLHPADVHRPELTGRDLALQRDVRIAAEVQRTESVAHDGPPGVAKL